MINNLIQCLKEKGWTLTVAESATCGLLGSQIGSISGASVVFKGGFIVYTQEAKHKLLGICNRLMDTHGTVSKEIAEVMVQNASDILHTNCAISVTGNAGPTSLENKPVGLFYIGFKILDTIIVDTIQLENHYSRNEARVYIADYCFKRMLDLLKK